MTYSNTAQAVLLQTKSATAKKHESHNVNVIETYWEGHMEGEVIQLLVHMSKVVFLIKEQIDTKTDMQ